jgi:hypothetical protein
MGHYSYSSLIVLRESLVASSPLLDPCPLGCSPFATESSAGSERGSACQFYEFQPRLAIVTRTLVIAVPDLLHFVAIFCTFLVLCRPQPRLRVRCAVTPNEAFPCCLLVAAVPLPETGTLQQQ